VMSVQLFDRSCHGASLQQGRRTLLYDTLERQRPNQWRSPDVPCRRRPAARGRHATSHAHGRGVRARADCRRPSWAWRSRRVTHRVIVHGSDAGLAAAWRAKQREVARRDSTRAATIRSRRSTLELAATCDHAPHLMNDHIRRDIDII